MSKENVETWLQNIGLQQYRDNFVRKQICSSKEMDVLKSFGRHELEKELRITKKGMNFSLIIVNIYTYKSIRIFLGLGRGNSS